MTKEEDDAQREHLRRETEAIDRERNRIEAQAARERAEFERLAEERRRSEQ